MLSNKRLHAPILQAPSPRIQLVVFALEDLSLLDQVVADVRVEVVPVLNHLLLRLLDFQLVRGQVLSVCFFRSQKLMDTAFYRISLGIET